MLTFVRIEMEKESFGETASHREDFADQLKAGLTTADWGQRREILRALVKRVEVDKETLRIVYKVPLHPFAKGPVLLRPN